MADDTTIKAIAIPEAPMLPAAATPMEMLSRALDRGADLTVLEKLMDLQERHERNQGRKAFDAAISDAKAEIPVIIKNREGHNSKYADLGAFAAAVNPVLAKHGLNYRYRSAQDGAAIRVTCILSHRDGHAEETTLSGAADATGNKNGIQAIASTLTYLQRYTLKLALGLADSEGDDDGQAAGGDEAISEEQATAIRKKIDDTNADAERFCRYWKIDAVPFLRKKDFANAMSSLDEAAKAKRQAKGAK